MSSEVVRQELRRQWTRAQERGAPYIDIKAGELHRCVGAYPGPDHRMPACCAVLRSEMVGGDTVVQEPPKGQGASLTIRYQLPRPPPPTTDP